VIRTAMVAVLGALAIYLGAGVLVAGCALEPDVGPALAGQCDPSDSDPDVDVDFGRDIRPLFDRPGNMGGCSCHGTGGTGQQLSGFDMSSMGSIRRGGEVSGQRIVVPGDPCNSVLVQKLSAAPPIGARMPLSGPPFFSDAELQLVQDWIAEGAIEP
jgi:hypothetical protein